MFQFKYELYKSQKLPLRVESDVTSRELMLRLLTLLEEKLKDYLRKFYEPLKGGNPIIRILSFLIND
jgi:hypothetical protein